MNGIMDLYSGACDMFVRPGRVTYTLDMLGPQNFRLGGESFVREDFQLVNSRDLKLECSHFYNAKHKRTNLGDVSQCTIKELKKICATHKIDIRNCVEKKDIITLIQQGLGSDKTEDLPPSPCIVYLHGNCGCRLDALDAVELSLLYGFSLFAVDLSGSGLSEGDYISLGYYEQDDVDCIVKYLKECPFVSSIGLWGRSMGAATSILYASKHPDDISALILDSPFSDLYTLSGEVVHQMKLGVPQWVLSSVFSLVMQMIRRSVRQKANFDLYAVAPINYVRMCEMPAIFIHGEADDFVMPKHSLSLCEQYSGKQKEILLVQGDHNAPRPMEAFNYISLFLYRYLYPEDLKEVRTQPLRAFGNSEATKSLDCFYCKQIKGMDHRSEWPFNVILCVGPNFIQLVTPYTEKITHVFRFSHIVHVYAREEQNLFIMQVPQQNSYAGSDGVLAFYCTDAQLIFSIIETNSKKLNK